ncbi:MAG: DVUA0089 family protein, partial [Planctomycetia bacterium]
MARSLENAMDLDSYSAEELASATQWVVGLSDSDESSPFHALAANADYLAETTFLPNAAVWEFDSTLDWTTVVDTLECDGSIEYFYPLVNRQYTTMFVPNDPLFTDQWHLDNTGQNGGTPGMDVNVVSAWDSVLGTNVVIGIADSCFQYTHPDLATNYRADLSWDFGQGDADPSPEPTDSPHGTSVAGVAGGTGNNDIGITGSAPDADLVGMRLDFSMGWSDYLESTVFSHHNQEIDIYNNSWGPNYYWGPYLTEIGPLTQASIQNAVTYGRGGLGNIIVFAGGNDREVGANTNYDGYAKSRYTIAVGALDHNGQYSYYSTPGSSLFISAYSNSSYSGITTTDLLGEDGYNSTGTGDGDPLTDIDYTSTFGGTSSATPLVSGIIGLMLEANPNLTYRDVQHILAETAIQTDPTNPSWNINGAGYHVSNDYGFGAIDAAAAVNMAYGWTNVDPEKQLSSGVVQVNEPIPEVGLGEVIQTFTMDDTIGNIEWVELTLDMDHSWVGDLEIILISPDGTESRLAEGTLELSDEIDGTWTLTTCHHWGESSEGEWTIIVRDVIDIDVGNWNTFELNIYGPGDVVPIDPVSAASLELIDVIPNSGDPITEGSIQHVAPRELTLVFNDEQKIDPDTIGAISMKRAGGDDIFLNLNDENVEFGYIAIGDRPNEIVIRFLDALPDDKYELTIIGKGDTPLATIHGTPFHGGMNQTITFNLDLGAQVTAIVPQPITRNVENNELSQSRNTIEVYFNPDTLDTTLAETEEFYRLSITPDDEVTTAIPPVYPISVVYDPQNNKATLTFAQDLEMYGTGVFRLRIGNEYKEIITTSMTAELVSDVFADATNVPNLSILGGAQSVIISSEIEALPYDIIYPGGNDDPGHRNLPSNLGGEEHVGSPDSHYGTEVVYYNFKSVIGVHEGTGEPYYNHISEKQKARAREIFELYSAYLGVDFVEDPSTTNPRGLIIATGNMKAIDSAIPIGQGGVAGLAGGGKAIMDIYENWGNNEYNGSWFNTAMHEIGHLLGLTHAYDLPSYTIMGQRGSINNGYYYGSAESMYPGLSDIIHGQYMHRPDSIDVDVYSFSLQVPGTFSAEIVAERLGDSSLLDSVITLYNSDHEIIARNDDYYSEDSYLELDLAAGSYYIAVSSTGNTEFDPNVPNSGEGGTSQGVYDLRLGFMSEATSYLADEDGTVFDGDLDGTPGGVYNFWFDVQAAEDTVFVDKLANPVGANGSLEHPYTQIDEAFAAINEERLDGPIQGKVVRIVGNRVQSFEDQETKYTFENPTDVAVGDFDNDGIADLVNISQDNGGDYYVQIYFGIDGKTYRATTENYAVGTNP